MGTGSILRRPSIGIEPASPAPSTDRLSVTFVLGNSFTYTYLFLLPYSFYNFIIKINFAIFFIFGPNNTLLGDVVMDPSGNPNPAAAETSEINVIKESTSVDSGLTKIFKNCFLNHPRSTYLCFIVGSKKQFAEKWQLSLLLLPYFRPKILFLIFKIPLKYKKTFQIFYYLLYQFMLFWT